MRASRIIGSLSVAACVLGLLASGPSRADESCRLSTDELTRQTTVPSPLLLLQSPDAGEVVWTACNSGRLDALALVLAPGQQAHLILVSHGHRPDARLDADPQYPGHDAVAWSAGNGELEDLKGGRIDLEIQVSARARPGLTDVRRLTWQDVDGDTRVTEIQLEVREAERMFRDNFQVDPTVGQFSF